MSDFAGKIRIIGGKWRGRTLSVKSLPGLRPTPSRIRETVFNWLSPTLIDSVCLDLFAGSGALGLEALSRGAKELIMLDNHAEVIQTLRDQIQILHAESETTLYCQDARSWLQKKMHEIKIADIVFIDPPFQSDLLEQTLSLLAKSQWVTVQTILYIESHQLLTQAMLSPTWEIVKQKKAGEVAYQLVRGGKP